MPIISAKSITTALRLGFTEIATILPADICQSLAKAKKQEKKPLAKDVISQLQKNALLAQSYTLPICQDTGTAIIFAEIGQNVQIKGDFTKAINAGVQKAYASLRKSIVADPLRRTNTKTNTPAVIHTEIVPGDHLTFYIMAKGGGAENKSTVKMLRPTATPLEILDVILETVKKADAAACPPLIVGVGIGGTFDTVPTLAKKALFRSLGTTHKDRFYKKLESDWLTAINKLNIGPAGYGGSTTALAVHINTAPCHIASLPVAINIQCHAQRWQKIKL